MRRRTLSLRRETLSELTAADLTRIAGAAYAATPVTCGLKLCIENISDNISCEASCGHSGCCSVDWC